MTFPSQKQEKKMCGMAQMYSWLTTLYGNSDDFNWSQFGLPTDKVRVLCLLNFQNGSKLT